MYAFEAYSLHQALQYGIEHLQMDGIEEPSRNGPVVVAPAPVITHYQCPEINVMLSPTRDANPFFHFFEALWMIWGRQNLINIPCYFLKSYDQFSDDGVSMWDAYGYRWRQWFGVDQLEYIARTLRNEPRSRRCVLSMWDGGNDETQGDLLAGLRGKKAVPCNTHAYFSMRETELSLTVCNRSNDVFWGCYGANVVQFSLLLQYMAAKIGVPVGTYTQFSNNFHAYTNVFSYEKMEKIRLECEDIDQDLLEFLDYPTIEPAEYEHDLGELMALIERLANGAQIEPYGIAWRSVYFQDLVAPMFLAFYHFKTKRKAVGLDAIKSPAWRRACSEWIGRRLAVSKG